MKIALAQINPTVGDMAGNVKKIREWTAKAVIRKADLIVFPELSVTGYPPRDLVEQGSFVRANREAVEALAKESKRIAIIVGFVDASAQRKGKGLYNAAAFLAKGHIQAIRHKTLLPNYDVFDEQRHFSSALRNESISFKGKKIGLTICEDMWHVPTLWPLSPYNVDPVGELARQGANLFINISSSPFQRGKTRVRLDLIRHHANRTGKPFLFVNQVGGNDEILFDGHSLALNANGGVMAQGKGFTEDLIIVDTDKKETTGWQDEQDVLQIKEALVMGIRDYARKCKFQSVVLGLSGGIDSAVTAALAVEALGKEHVVGLLMPSPFSSRGSLTDALALAKNLGIRTHTISISPLFATYKKSLKKSFAGRKPDVAEENLQARIRGTLLMAMSNKFGSLLLTTGNKSELSMGYCTLYGDMNGGLAVISDVLKTTVYRLGRALNLKREVIPEASFSKPPSAELRPNQTDQDSLPPYEILDGIVAAYVEEGKDVQEIVARGYEEKLVRRVVSTIDRNEYKRRQAAPGLRISPKAFGMGRRMPIARGDFRAAP